MGAQRHAAVPAKSGAQQSVARRRQRRDRVALGVATLLLAAGVIVFWQSRTSEGPAPTQAAPGQSQAPVAVKDDLKPGGKLTPAARTVVVRFLKSAVGRTELATSWDLATPELRAGVTRAQWMRGELPVVPFPVGDLETSGFQILESGPNKVLLQVLLVPEPGTEYNPTRYDMTVERATKTAPWKVSYTMPYAPPGKYSAPE